MESRELIWKNKKKGKFGASEIHRLMTKSGKWTDDAVLYLREIAYERSQNVLRYISGSTLSRGVENEPYAYEWARENLFLPTLKHCDSDYDEKLFFERPDLGAGASPDCLTEDGRVGVELKSLVGNGQRAVFLSPTLPIEEKRKLAEEKHLWQIAFQFLCIPTLEKLYLVQYDSFVEQNETDERDLLDPNRGTAYLYSRIDLVDNILVVKERVSFANWLLESGHDPSEAQELWDRAHPKPVEEKPKRKKRSNTEEEEEEHKVLMAMRELVSSPPGAIF
jgi:hypothetical protein